MPLHCSLRAAGIGRTIRVDRPIFHVNNEKYDHPLQSDLSLGQYLIRLALREDRNPNLLAVVSSLPRVHRALMAATLAKTEGMNVSGIMEFGGHCGATIDALHHMFCAVDSKESCLMVTLDSFMSSYGAESGGDPWLDGGSAILVNPMGCFEFELLSYVSAFDSDFLYLAHAAGKEIDLPLIPIKSHQFAEVDEKAIRSIMHMATTQCNISMNELDGVVAINRSSEALARLKRIFGSTQLYQSRLQNSHSGGSDLIANLISAIDAIDEGVICMLGFGFGYSWQAMIVKISHPL